MLKTSHKFIFRKLSIYLFKVTQFDESCFIIEKFPSCHNNCLFTFIILMHCIHRSKIVEKVVKRHMRSMSDERFSPDHQSSDCSVVNIRDFNRSWFSPNENTEVILASPDWTRFLSTRQWVIDYEKINREMREKLKSWLSNKMQSPLKLRNWLQNLRAIKRSQVLSWERPKIHHNTCKPYFDWG